MSAEIIHGDCLKIAPTLAGIDAVVSDPPYGIDHDTDYTRFTGGASKVRNTFDAVTGDDEPFDPTPWLDYPAVVLFGANCYSDKLPCGTWLIWCKRRDEKLGKFMSDCEAAWQKGGHGVYLFHHIWDGFDRESERGTPRVHPTQKPVALMEWAIKRLRLPMGATILDPYCGSGATGIAATNLGYRFIGIEDKAGYVEIARRRIADAQSQLSLGVA